MTWLYGKAHPHGDREKSSFSNHSRLDVEMRDPTLLLLSQSHHSVLLNNPIPCLDFCKHLHFLTLPNLSWATCSLLEPVLIHSSLAIATTKNPLEWMKNTKKLAKELVKISKRRRKSMYSDRKLQHHEDRVLPQLMYKLDANRFLLSYFLILLLFHFHIKQTDFNIHVEKQEHLGKLWKKEQILKQSCYNCETYVIK